MSSSFGLSSTSSSSSSLSDEKQPTTALAYKISPLNEMVSHFPELAAVANGQAVCTISDIKKRPRKNKDPLVEQSTSLSESSGLSHEREAMVNPWKSKLFREMLSRLPPRKWVEMTRAVDCTNTEKVERMLRLNHANLFLSKSHHDSVLLGEAGSFLTDGKMVTYPPCSNGSKCKGMDTQYRYRGQTKDVIWMSYLYPEELDQLLNNGFHGGSCKPCLLCLRNMALDTEITHRLIDRKSSVHGTKVNKNQDSKDDENGHLSDITNNRETGKSKLDTDDSLHDFIVPICQIFYNLVDQVHGYHRDYVIISEPGRPLICPIARPNLSLLLAYKEKSTNRWMVNQSAILWRSPILSHPQPGENIQGF